MKFKIPALIQNLEVKVIGTSKKRNCYENALPKAKEFEGLVRDTAYLIRSIRSHSDYKTPPWRHRVGERLTPEPSVAFLKSLHLKWARCCMSELFE